MSRIGVLGWACRTSAGDLDALMRTLAEGGRTFDSPPHPIDGLRNPLCGIIRDLERERPAELLLESVVREALSHAGWDLPPEGTGLIVGTSSGNICGPFERWHRAFLEGDSRPPHDVDRAAPTRVVARRLGFTGPVCTLSTACTSGTAVADVAARWLLSGRTRSVVCAGVDALSLYVHAGFSGLGALTADLPRPFAPNRDGLLLGEGAAALVLVHDPPTAPVWLIGTGISSDGTHMTAPDRAAGGALRALDGTLAMGGLSPAEVDLVSVHGTGTPYNDAMEIHCLNRRFRPGEIAVHGVKQAIGHTMGAAGAIEAVVLAQALHTGRPPPPPRAHEAILRPRDSREPPRTGISMSSAFGGMNACLALSRDPRELPWHPTEPHLQAEARSRLPETASEWRRAHPDAPRRISRLDGYGRVVWSALQTLGTSLGPSCALVLSSTHTCRAADLRYHARLVREGAAHAPRLDFTHTLPAAPICEASVALGLRGPLLAFVGPPGRGDDEARDLVAAGRVPEAVSVAVEAPENGGTGQARARLWRRSEAR